MNLVEIFVINNLTDNDWRKPIVSYLENPDGLTCRKIKYKALSYVIMGDELFKKTPEGVLLKALGKLMHIWLSLILIVGHVECIRQDIK